MSTGDWFTLNPLNLKNYQTEIDQLTSNVNFLNNELVAVNDVLGTLQNQTNTINDSITNMTTQLTSLTLNLNSLTNQVNGMYVNLTSLINLYEPIYSFYANNLTFTDGTGNSSPGELYGFWYRPMIFFPDKTFTPGGEDLKYLILVLLGINIPNITNNGDYWISNIFPLPVNFVNNNTYRVFWQSSSTDGTGSKMTTSMNTAQAYYVIYNSQINNWVMEVKYITNNGINNDSACFIVMYI
jgi:hypothetical protein